MNEMSEAVKAHLLNAKKKRRFSTPLPYGLLQMCFHFERRREKTPGKS